MLNDSNQLNQRNVELSSHFLSSDNNTLNGIQRPTTTSRLVNNVSLNQPHNNRSGDRNGWNNATTTTNTSTLHNGHQNPYSLHHNASVFNASSPMRPQQPPVRRRYGADKVPLSSARKAAPDGSLLGSGGGGSVLPFPRRCMEGYSFLGRKSCGGGSRTVVHQEGGRNGGEPSDGLPPTSLSASAPFPSHPFPDLNSTLKDLSSAPLGPLVSDGSLTTHWEAPVSRGLMDPHRGSGTTALITLREERIQLRERCLFIRLSGDHHDTDSPVVLSQIRTLIHKIQRLVHYFPEEMYYQSGENHNSHEPNNNNNNNTYNRNTSTHTRQNGSSFLGLLKFTGASPYRFLRPHYYQPLLLAVFHTPEAANEVLLHLPVGEDGVLEVSDSERYRPPSPSEESVILRTFGLHNDRERHFCGGERAGQGRRLWTAVLGESSMLVVDWANLVRHAAGGEAMLLDEEAVSLSYLTPEETEALSTGTVVPKEGEAKKETSDSKKKKTVASGYRLNRLGRRLCGMPLFHYVESAFRVPVVKDVEEEKQRTEQLSGVQRRWQQRQLSARKPAEDYIYCRRTELHRAARRVFTSAKKSLRRGLVNTVAKVFQLEVQDRLKQPDSDEDVEQSLQPTPTEEVSDVYNNRSRRDIIEEEEASSRIRTPQNPYHPGNLSPLQDNSVGLGQFIQPRGSLESRTTASPLPPPQDTEFSMQGLGKFVHGTAKQQGEGGVSFQGPDNKMVELFPRGGPRPSVPAKKGLSTSEVLPSDRSSVSFSLDGDNQSNMVPSDTNNNNNNNNNTADLSIPLGGSQPLSVNTSVSSANGGNSSRRAIKILSTNGLRFLSKENKGNYTVVPDTHHSVVSSIPPASPLSIQRSSITGTATTSTGDKIAPSTTKRTKKVHIISPDRD